MEGFQQCFSDVALAWRRVRYVERGAFPLFPGPRGPTGEERCHIAIVVIRVRFRNFRNASLLER